MDLSRVDSHLFVIFGGSGDLARRKLLPSLYNLLYEKGLRDRCTILGVGRSPMTDDRYRKIADDSIAEFGDVRKGRKSWCDRHVFYYGLKEGTAASYDGLRMKMEELERTNNIAGNRVLYLALPPGTMEATMTRLGEAGIHRSGGWTRAVVEKPFGHDLPSAVELNALIHRYFSEDDVYRIDHYLGKETVQNILVFRFANPIFESMWNRDRISSIEIMAAETDGIGDRATYYEGVGAFRDMIQNHLTQLLTLVAMEVPAAYDADSIRHEKLKVLRSVRPLSRESVSTGQYAKARVNGKAVKGYLEEDGIEGTSTTETFVDLALHIDNWRWQGVPFRLKTGKRLPKRETSITVTFKEAPVCLFQAFDACQFSANRLVIRLQPDEGFSLSFEVKEPGESFQIASQDFSFSYSDQFGRMPEAYQTLIHDILRGDHTLFVHGDEVERAWEIYTPIIENMPEPSKYPAGTWGPR